MGQRRKQLPRERAGVSHGKEKTKRQWLQVCRPEGGQPWKAAMAFQEGMATLPEVRPEGRKQGSKTPA